MGQVQGKRKSLFKKSLFKKSETTSSTDAAVATAEEVSTTTG